MSTAQTFKLIHAAARTGALHAVKTAPDGFVCVVRPPNRSDPQNKRFHAMLNDIMASGFAVEDEPLDAEDLKVMFVAAWMDENQQPSRIVRGFHGKPVQLRKSTKTFNKREMGELMILVEKFCAERGIALKDDGLGQ